VLRVCPLNKISQKGILRKLRSGVGEDVWGDDFFRTHETIFGDGQTKLPSNQ
jgi:hypothetical protein